MQTAIQNEDVLARVEALRDAEGEARQPLLKRFRETPEEREIRAVEGLIPTITSDEALESGQVYELARGIELLCQEGRRFERWLDTLPVSETQDYREHLRRVCW